VVCAGKIYKKLNLTSQAMMNFSLALDLKPTVTDVNHIKSAIEAGRAAGRDRGGALALLCSLALAAYKHSSSLPIANAAKTYSGALPLPNPQNRVSRGVVDGGLGHHLSSTVHSLME